MIVRLFPYTLITLDICAGLVYFWTGDIKRGVYWLAAATLTLCVTL